MSRFKARCDTCGISKSLSDILCLYRLSDSTMVNVEKTFAWCGTCRDVVWAEHIPNLKELEQRLEQVEHPSPELYGRYELAARWMHSTVDQQMLAERVFRRKQLLWRRSRQSLARCLACGGTNIVVATADETHGGNRKWELNCGRCTGRISILKEPILNLSRCWLEFTPEGEQIQDDEMSSSKSATPSDTKL